MVSEGFKLWQTSFPFSIHVFLNVSAPSNLKKSHMQAAVHCFFRSYIFFYERPKNKFSVSEIWSLLKIFKAA